MAKRSQLDQAITALEAEKAVLDVALAKLRQQQGPKPARTEKKTAPRASSIPPVDGMHGVGQGGTRRGLERAASD